MKDKDLPPCQKTVSGDHIWVIVKPAENVELKACFACGLVDDREVKVDKQK